MYDMAPYEMVLNALDVVTIVIPPALPVAMSAGISFALDRLSKQQIFCTSPPRINIAGKLNLLCFDKTGTLTESDLGVYGVLSAGPHAFERMKTRVPFTSRDLLHCLVSCHSLARIGEDLVGDPLEVKMFEATSWIFDDAHIPETPDGQDQFARWRSNETGVEFDYEILATVQPNIEKYDHDLRKTSDDEEGIVMQAPSTSPKDPHAGEGKYLLSGAEKKSRSSRRSSVAPEEIQYVPSDHTKIFILRRFGFSASLQRMSVIAAATAEPSQQLEPLVLYCKGSPEMIATLCLPHTLPKDYHEVLLRFVQRLSCARMRTKASAIHLRGGINALSTQ